MIKGLRYTVKTFKNCAHALVAQLDRALDYESRGREFESSRARHPPLHIYPCRFLGFLTKSLTDHLLA